ncbi:DEKNAAC103421 [Brettanomyces naardenensis]|uniref:DEKNAAC103422 n=1 Tax=Brettanomyces naardenensis TaxID=13370 RepID=A0A448YNB6_BRENA|nr:DEKNAAC103421 [Brettanomyces naardenensis]
MGVSEEILFKTALKMTVSKLQFKADKMRTLNKLALSSISKELKGLAGGKGAKFDRGLTLTKIRLSKLVNDDNTADTYEILMVDCELLLSKLNRLLAVRHDRKTGEIEGGDELVLRLARKLMFASNYVNIKEFRKLVTLLVGKFGKPFYEEAIKVYPYGGDSADEDFAKKCKGGNVDELTEMYLREFCDTYKIDLYGEGKYDEEEKEDEDGDGGDDEPGDGEKIAEKKVEKVKEAPIGNDIDDLKKRFEALKRL